MQEGHYRTALCVEGRVMFVTDDNIPTCSAQSQDVHDVQSNAYLFLLCKS